MFIRFISLSFKWDGFINDELKLTQTILDNIPGLNDGITGNESVFVNYGVMTSDNHKIDFNVVPGAWKSNTGSTNTQQFRLNSEYVDWYTDIETNHKNALGLDYERIRWGNSVIRQNQAFDPDWLTVCEINADTNTVILGVNKAFELDGDILIKFNGKTPVLGEKFDLIKAATITSANTNGLFDRVLFDGFTPQYYTLSVINSIGGQVLRLEITGPPSGCITLVTSTLDSGTGTLRDALACVSPGGTITLDPSLANQAITLTSSKLVINKNVTINSGDKSIKLKNMTNKRAIEIASGNSVVLNNFQILSDVFTNAGTLECNNMTFKNNDNPNQGVFISETGSVLILNNTSGVN